MLKFEALNCHPQAPRTVRGKPEASTQNTPSWASMLLKTVLRESFFTLLYRGSVSNPRPLGLQGRRGMGQLVEYKHCEN